MDEYKNSINKGCFAHKPEKIKNKKSGGHVAIPLKEDVKQSLWNEIETKIENIEKKSYTETFVNGIVKFVNDSFQFPLLELKEVPAAVLVMGVNMPDHINIFNLLEKQLHLNGIYSTVILESKKCTTVPNMLQSILNEIHKKYTELFNIGDELPKKQEYGFMKLYEYYTKTQEVKVLSPTKRKKNLHTTIQNVCKPIVFLIQDVECFSSEILQKLIFLCKIYSGKLPIVLIFGMSSAMVTLHSILPPKALMCLGLETFYSAFATEYLTKIIEEVIISPELPFKFGPKMFRLIVDSVLYHDFSVSNLTYMLKFAIIEHLYGKSFTSLCCHEDEIEKKVHQLSPEDLQALKALPSLKRYLDNNPSFISCTKNPTIFKESIIGFMKKLYHDQRQTLLLLKLLHCFVKDLPEYPLGKRLRELYSVSLEKEICLSTGFNDALKLLKLQSQQNLMIKLAACLNVLKESTINSSLIKEIKKTLEDSVEKLSKLTTSDFDKSVQEPLLLQSDKITSRFQLQEKIQLSIKLKRSNFEAVRNEIIEDLHQIFKNIYPPSHSPLFEIFYFDDVSSVKKHLMAVPRVTSCYTLSNPHHYLKCKCCKISSSDEIQSTMPETCLLYKLHLESGKLINLYDWLEGFKTIKASGENIVKRSRTKPKVNDNDLNVRFLLAVSELQMLGFIKPTKRKTDHVSRTTFGCF
ncbi:origin recognition complex subunit 3 [Trichonephila inaurata madagascariensis]|uniref:Origin recognition complex subunit 3 n=1 Tax=Trichonephila inaurata madagascariensis TaxID=2747483 RepID=A0A8X7CIV1_9ARAC|nr:origin recognition complex subunit 3 [Trichonephila inaurata madagascariensis]